jgi:hypothetical protein
MRIDCIGSVSSAEQVPAVRKTGVKYKKPNFVVGVYAGTNH